MKRSVSTALSLALFSSIVSGASPSRTGAELTADVNSALGLSNSHVARVEVGPVGSAMVAAIELAGQSAQMVLMPTAVRSPGFQLLEARSDGSLVAVEPVSTSHFRGELVDVPGSRVAASLTDEGLYARVMLADGQEYWMQPMAAHVVSAQPDEHAVFSSADVIEVNRPCASDLLPGMGAVPDLGAVSGGNSGGGTLAMTTLKIAELACDADYEYFLDYGSSGAVQSRIESIVNAINLQYESEVGISHALTSIIVRTSSNDPYSSTDAVTLLNQFRNEWNANQGGIVRDVAQLFSGKEIDGGTIGIAWVGAVCSSYGYGMVQSDFNNNFACATDLSAHEAGHNWDAGHCNCTSNTMNPYITCANTFHPSLTIPEIVAFRDSLGCLSDGSGPGGDPVSIHVASIVPETVNVGQGRKRARATVTITDDQGAPAAGALVFASFAGGINETVSGLTNGSGVVTLTTSGFKKGKLKFTVCVDNVSGGLPYAPADNAESCDSN